MPGLVAPFMCRYTVNGTYAGRPVANIIDMAVGTSITTGTREECLADLAGIIVSAWADDVLDFVGDQYTAQTVSWVDLDTIDGSTGETSVGAGTDFPASGSASTDQMPGSVAFRIGKQISATRGTRQGRMYIVGVPEGVTAAGTPNTVAAGTITAVNGAMATFLDAINVTVAETALDYDSHMVVLHTSSDDNPTPPPKKLITYEGASTITSLVCDPTLATQRRRLRG